MTPPKVSTDIAERVARGAAWLDTDQPGWADRIDLDELSMSDACLCVLGQAFKDRTGYGTPTGFDAVVARVGTRQGDRHSLAWALDNGFDAYGSTLADAERDYERLTAAWRELILDRRAAQ